MVSLCLIYPLKVLSVNQDSEIILNGNFPGLLPLVPLMGEAGQLMERLLACEAAISEQVELKARQQDLLAVAVLLSSLQPRSQEIIEDFFRSRRMVDLMESPLLKDWLHDAEGKGAARGRLEGEKLMLLRLLTRKFGDLPSALLSKLETVTSVEQLESLLDTAMDAATLDYFTQHLDC